MGSCHQGPQEGQATLSRWAGEVCPSKMKEQSIPPGSALEGTKGAKESHRGDEGESGSRRRGEGWHLLWPAACPVSRGSARSLLAGGTSLLLSRCPNSIPFLGSHEEGRASKPSAM